MTKQAPPNDEDLVTLSVRVSRTTADRLKKVADANYRPVAAHMRLLIESDVARAISTDATGAEIVRVAA